MAKKQPATAKAGNAKDDKSPSVGPVQYLGQVRQEARKVVWPTWRETLTTTILVMIMVVLMGIFFFIVDWALANIIRMVLGRRISMAAKWYIVQAYSNFEKHVQRSIEREAEQKGLSHLFEEILVPTESVVEVRKGRKVESERKFFPGYVLVKCELTDAVHNLVKNTPKVTGFLGSTTKPLPVSG